MYAYCDRRPCQLPIAARTAVLGLRIWVRAMYARKDRLRTLQSWLTEVRAGTVAWPAHNFYYWLGAHGSRPFCLGCPGCGAVSEDEAMMLSALLPEDSEARTSPEALSAIINPDAAVHGAALADKLRAALDASGVIDRSAA